MIMQRFVTKSNPRQRTWEIIALSLATICLIYSSGLLARAMEVQDQAGIEQAITQYIRSELPATFQVTSQIGKMDTRLRLPKCPQALEAYYPTSAKKLGPTTIGVRCLSNINAWQIYVPVQIKAFGPAVISKRALPRGTIVHSSDLTMATRELSRALRGYYTSVDEIIGMELRHSLPNGGIISPKSLKPRHLVKRGDIITIVAESKGLHIRVKGTALMDGFRGQSIRIKNTRTKRELQGEVVASRTVKVTL